MAVKMRTVMMDMTKGIDEALLAQAGQILRRGGLVAFPTETVYGLGGNALDEGASERIYLAKGRPSDNPLIVHIAGLKDLYPIVSLVPEQALALAQAFWPGPLTMILPKSDLVPEKTTGGLDTVAVRMPNHPAALGLIRAGGGYVAAPSANTSGRPSPTSAAHVREDLDGRIDAIIDGGDVGIGLESTIIDLTEEIPVILRPGYISPAMLRQVLGEVRFDQALLHPGEHVRPKAPGMKYRHYAPRASMTIVEGEREAVTARINALAQGDLLAGRSVGILSSDETAARYPQGLVLSAGTLKDEITIAQQLYGNLREFDRAGVDVIYAEAFETPQIGDAIMNRLVKAAGHRILKA